MAMKSIRGAYGCDWFTQWFQRTLKKRKLTIDEVSELTGIGKATLAYYFSGTRSPSLKTFMVIIQTLGYELNIREK